MGDWKDWRGYQEAVAQAFRQLGYAAETDQKLEGVRGSHDIDVLVTYQLHGIDITWIVECKLWKSRVKKADVITLQGIVADGGADRGFLFSESGFQSGGEKMTEASNVTLVTSLTDFVATAHADAAPTAWPLAEIADLDGAPPVLRLPGVKSRPQHIGNYQDLLVVGDWGAGAIFFVHPTYRRVAGKIDLDRYESRGHGGERQVRPHVPGSFAVAVEKLFLAQVFSDYVLAIDLPTYSIVKRIPIRGGGEGSLTATVDGNTVFFASNKSNALYEIDVNTYVATEFPYPAGGRGSMSVALSQDETGVYVGIQRGYPSQDPELPPGGSFLARFDRSSRSFSETVPLYEADSMDASIPACILTDPSSDRIYIGMFQGRRGILVVEPDPLRIVNATRPEPNNLNRHFEWVDPLAMKFHKHTVLALFRNNRELVALDPESLEVRHRKFLGDVPNGPRDLTVLNDQVVITYPERSGLIVLDSDASGTNGKSA